MEAWPMRPALRLMRREMEEDACLEWARPEAGNHRKGPSEEMYRNAC